MTTEKKIKKISFSEYQVWKTCQHKHYLSYRLRVSDLTNEILIFGKTLHASLEKYLKGEFNRMVYKSKFLKCLEEEIANSNNPDLNINAQEFAKQAEKIFQKLDFVKNFKDVEIISVEELIQEKLIDSENEDEVIYYKGFVDLIIRDKITGRYTIIDWKSAMKPWNLEKKIEDKTFFGQLVLYRYFIAQKLGIDKNLIDTKFIALIRYGDKLVEHFQINISEVFENFILEDIKKAAVEIRNKDSKFIKRRTEGKLSEPPCQYCSFKNTSKCNNQEFQLFQYDENNQLTEIIEKIVLPGYEILQIKDSDKPLNWNDLT